MTIYAKEKFQHLGFYFKLTEALENDIIFDFFNSIPRFR